MICYQPGSATLDTKVGIQKHQGERIAMAAKPRMILGVPVSKTENEAIPKGKENRVMSYSDGFIEPCR